MQSERQCARQATHGACSVATSSASDAGVAVLVPAAAVQDTLHQGLEGGAPNRRARELAG